MVFEASGPTNRRRRERWAAWLRIEATRALLKEARAGHTAAWHAQPIGSCCGQRVGKEETAVGAEEMCDASGSVQGEDRQAPGSLRRGKGPLRRSRRWYLRSMPTMRTAKFCSVRGTGVKGSGSEMWAQASYECGRANDEEGLAGEGIPEAIRNG